MPRPDGTDWSVQLIGSNTSATVASNILITAGSTYTVPTADYNCKTVGFGVRLSASQKFKVQIQPNTPGGVTAIGPTITVIDQSTTAALFGSQNYTLTQRRNTITVANADTVDFTISTLAITNFYT